MDARSFSSITSCSGPTRRRGARLARRSPMGSTASVVHLRTSRCRIHGGVAGAACEAAGVQAADGLDVPLGIFGRRRASTTTSTSRSPKSNSAEAAPNITTAGHSRDGRKNVSAGRRGERDPGRRLSGRVCAREAGHERVCAARTASSTTPIRPTRGAWTACGACTSGSTAPPRAATITGVWWRHHDRYGR